MRTRKSWWRETEASHTTLHKWLFTNSRAKTKSQSSCFQSAIFPHLPGLLKQSDSTHQHPVSPSFIFHRPFRNVSFGLRCLWDGSRPRRRQKVYPLAPRPAVASVAPCSPAPYKSLSKPPIIHHRGKGVIIVPMTPDNPPWTAPLPLL